MGHSVRLSSEHDHILTRSEGSLCAGTWAGPGGGGAGKLQEKVASGGSQRPPCQDLSGYNRRNAA